jgi:acetyltransferase-like isoleucine patch superfamily enzyme
MSSIATTAKIYPNVRLGTDVRIGPWAVVGRPPASIAAGELETVIGDGSIIRSHSVIYAGSRTGSRFQTGHHAIVGPALEIGNRCSVGTSSYVSGFARLGSGARIHGHCYVGDFAWIEEKAWVGPYNILESNFDQISAVGRGAILAMGVHLLPGVRIGDRALVGMRSLIQRDIAPYRVVVGNPPRAIRTIDQIVSPIPEVGRPYDADPIEMQQAAMVRHAARNGCAISDDDWRRSVWQAIQMAQYNRQDPDWQLVPTYEPSVVGCISEALAK